MSNSAINLDTATSQSAAQDFLDKLRQWQMPTQKECIDYLANSPSLDKLQAVVLLVCGLVYLLYGWKIFKVLVIVNAAMLGAIAGTKLGGMLNGANMPLFGGVAGALLLAMLAWPLMKYAVSVMGGLAGSFLGYQVWRHVTQAAHQPNLDSYAWVGALMGLVTLGLLAFIIFRATIIIVTACQGALLTVAGALALLLHIETTRPSVKSALEGNSHLLALLFIVPALIGFAFQMTGGKAGGGKRPAAAAATSAAGGGGH